MDLARPQFAEPDLTPVQRVEAPATPVSPRLDLPAASYGAPGTPVQRQDAVAPPPEAPPEAAPVETPPAAAPPAGAPAAGASGAPGAAGGAAAQTPEQLEELARRLVGPLTRRLKAEMLLDRERRGLRTDLR
jgi:hypothetical protein